LASAKRKAVLVKVSQRELDLLRERAQAARRPLATYLRECGLTVRSWPRERS
jgi:hypothetical protein